MEKTRSIKSSDGSVPIAEAEWILLDTETTGLAAPIFVVDLAAQRMRGWQPDHEPFHKLLNQNAHIPAEATRIHGYTREILERDGEQAHQVYRQFADYADGMPLVSFNLEYDLDDVLLPEWKRLGISPIGSRGFCVLRLAQRLLDPVPAGNCKLQTLRQYYRLPERSAHTALGDVHTVADLLSQVLRPIAEHRGLNTWEKLVEYAAAEWYPSRIPFGKHKGRVFREARHSPELRRWLDWLAASSNPRSAGMGRWYLQQLEMEDESQAEQTLFTAPAIESEESPAATRAGAPHSPLVIYVNPELDKMRQVVAGARARLAELEAAYTKEKSRVDAMQAILFRRLREHYQKRNRLRLIVDYRKKYLDSLIRGGEEEAKQAEENYEKAKANTDKDYEDTAATVAKKKQLTNEEEAELTTLWKKLVKLYHPDRFAEEPDKLETYGKLTSAINRAKDAGDIETLREIANDPAGFILRQGWQNLDFSEDVALAQLRRLHDTLQMEIISVIESLDLLRESPDYRLSQIIESNPAVLEKLVAERAELVAKENAVLTEQAARIGEEIGELCGQAPDAIS